MKRYFASLVALCLFTAAPQAARRYTAARDGDVVTLTDTRNDTRVSIMPSVGNIAFDMQVRGQRMLRSTQGDAARFKASPNGMGIPFMGPWINRLDEQAFYANGKRYAFDMELGNVRGAIPIHGFLTTTDQWRVVGLNQSGDHASVTSRLEFFRQPAWMKQWPFAHTIEVTYRLKDGMLEVMTTVSNMSADPMPISIGFHPYFQLTDTMRDDWTIAVGARTRWTLAANKVPTGATEPIETFFPDPAAAHLREYDLDDVFSDLVRDAHGRATMSVKGKSQQLDVFIGPRYRAAVIYAPKAQNFICFEPMAGITNALNLAQKGLYKELQTIAPGGTWTESFWVRASGF
ncbi:MAG TPA: aldose 1-epimerase [Vicinamibacterales bacterium]|nr:aldose 1-epimerase [Vicinamibacterales bacterium]